MEKNAVKLSTVFRVRHDRFPRSFHLRKVVSACHARRRRRRPRACICPRRTIYSFPLEYHLRAASTRIVLYSYIVVLHIGIVYISQATFVCVHVCMRVRVCVYGSRTSSVPSPMRSATLYYIIYTRAALCRSIYRLSTFTVRRSAPLFTSR